MNGTLWTLDKPYGSVGVGAPSCWSASPAFGLDGHALRGIGMAAKEAFTAAQRPLGPEGGVTG